MVTAIKFIGLTIVSHFAIAGAEIVVSKMKDNYQKHKAKRSNVEGCENEEATI